MQSPKFVFSKHELSKIMGASALRDAWKTKTKTQLRRQVIFDPIEFRDFSENLEHMVEIISQDIIQGNYRVSPAKRYLAEKSKGLCRQMTLVHPRDLLVLERLARVLYFQIKKSAPSKNAFFEPDDGKFRFIARRHDARYGSFASWLKFQKEVFRFSKENKYIIISDVANFYDFINFVHLRNIVSSLTDVSEPVLDLLIYVLNGLTWTPDYMPLCQTGMPQIETTATRVLANAMLYEVDKVCEGMALSNYARFMDDIDIGVDSPSKARKIVRDVDLTLQARQLRLNSAKTKIMTSAEASVHFCIKENALLDRIESILTKKPENKKVKFVISQIYEQWLDRRRDGAPSDRSPFLRGNGAKVHKFILRIMHRSGVRIPRRDLFWMIRFAPNLRGTALGYLSHEKLTNHDLKELVEIAESNLFVDDESYVNLVSCLLHAKLPYSNSTRTAVERISRASELSGDIGLYMTFFLDAKYLGEVKLIEKLERNRRKIKGDFWLSRGAGGLVPFFVPGPHAERYHSFISSLHSPDADEIFNYLLDLKVTTKLSNGLTDYLRAKNKSYPQDIFFPKAVMILALRGNRACKTFFDSLVTTHVAFQSDRFLQALAEA